MNVWEKHTGCYDNQCVPYVWGGCTRETFLQTACSRNMTLLFFSNFSFFFGGAEIREGSFDELLECQSDIVALKQHFKMLDL